MTWLVIAALAMAVVFVGIALIRKPRRSWEADDDGWDFEGRSQGMPERPQYPEDAECAFGFPTTPDHVNMLTRPCGPLNGRMIVIEYEIIGDVSFVGQQERDVGSMSLYFQREGDDWSGVGKMADYRWWRFNRLPLRPGRFVRQYAVDGQGWTNARGQSGEAFAEAARNAARMGVTFGGQTVAAHGAYATGPARFVLHRFEVV